MKIRFKDLTPKQKDYICNGCGGKGFIKAPKFLEFACCDHHDFNYWLGFTKADRKKADVQFLEAMRMDASRQPALIKPFRYAQARLFYQLVRLFGWKFFNDVRKKTLYDLEREMR